MEQVLIEATSWLTDGGRGPWHALGMTYPRAHTVNPQVSGFYHCTSRCVRRAWLCGLDAVSGCSFEHRRAWIENRILELTDIFAVQLYGYAVMSNHYHVVVRTMPEQVGQWSDEEVATRWMWLCNVPDEAIREQRIRATVQDWDRLAELRRRLSDLSWFMRYINEPLARRANREDGCTGRFWQGRFHSEALLDEAAVLAAMAYVDLNPVRAGVVAAPERAEHTALARRLLTEASPAPGLGRLEDLGLVLVEYVSMVRWTARPDHNLEPLPRTGARISCTAEDWRRRIKALRRHCRVQGAAPLLRQFAVACGQSWVRGVAWAPSR